MKQPHSIIVHDEDIIYAGSATHTVKKNGKVIVDLDIGYTRGLIVKNNLLIVGSSVGRKKSKSTGIIVDNTEIDDKESLCKVTIFQKGFPFYKYKPIDTFNFYPEYQEIYDILLLE